MPYFSARLDFPSPTVSAPGSLRMRGTREFLALPPFSPPASHMTIKGRVFVTIMKVKLELGSGLGLWSGLGLLVRVRVIG